MRYWQRVGCGSGAAFSAIVWRLIAGLAVLALAASPALADGLPWRESRLLYDHSTPALTWLETQKLALHGDRLAVLAKGGLTLFVFDGASWRPGPSAAIETPPIDIAWVGEHVAILTQAGLLLVDARNGASRMIRDLDCPSGQYGAIGHVPGTGQLLATMAHRTYLVDVPEGTFRRVASASLANKHRAMLAPPSAQRLLVLNGQQLLTWDPTAEAFAVWKDASDQPLELEKPGRSLSAHPDGRWLYVGTSGGGLRVVDLAQRAVHRVDAAALPEVEGKHVWPVAVDVRRNTLYVSTWREVVAIAPANDPAQWRFVGTLSAMTEPALHTYRDAAPSSGALYLPQSDQLLFGGKWGLTVLSAGAGGAFVQSENFEQYRYPASEIPGSGPLYDELRQHKLQAIWSGSGRVSPETLDNHKRAGINTLFYNIYFIEHGEFYPPYDVRTDLREMARLCEQRGIRLVAAARPYSLNTFAWSGMKEHDYRRLILRSGEIGRYSRKSPIPAYDRLEYPCYFDEAHWAQSVERNMVEIARLAAEVPIAGLMYELGDGFSSANFSVANEPCLCDDCWGRFLDAQGVEDQAVRDLTAADSRRYRWLGEQKRWSAYQDHQRQRLARLVRESFEAAQAVHPEITAWLALPETTSNYEDVWFYNAFMDGFGTSERPVIVCSQQTYAAPFSPPMMIGPGRRMREAGQHVIYIPGLVTYWHSPDQLARRTRTLLDYTPGVWFYLGQWWEGERLDENHMDSYIARDEREFPLRSYIEALGASGR